MLRYSLALVSSAYFQLLLALGSSGNISDITPQLSSLENGLQEVFDQMSEVRKEMEKQQLLHTQLEVHVAELVQEFHSWESKQQLTKHHESLCSCSELQTRLVGVENVISDLQTMLKLHKTGTSPNPTLPSLDVGNTCIVDEETDGTEYDHGDSTSEVNQGETVTVRCSHDYFMDLPSGIFHNATLICVDGKWQHNNKQYDELPKCKRETCKLPDLQNGNYEGDYRHAEYLLHDETALYTCNAGYSFPEGDQPQVKCVLGELVPSAPVCHEDCIIPNDIESGMIWLQPQMKPTRYFHGLYIKYRCQGQHQQDLSTRCDKGTWIPHQPECEQQGCPNAETTEHGTVYKKIVNGLLLYHYCCDQDYILRGYPVLQCTNGHLNSTKPVCKAERVSGYYYQLHVKKMENGNSPYLDSQSINHNGMTELKLDCYRPRYGQIKYGVNWMYVDGSYNEGSVYVNKCNNIITFRGTLQGRVTYRCTYWDPYNRKELYTLSRCQTINFY